MKFLNQPCRVQFAQIFCCEQAMGTTEKFSGMIMYVQSPFQELDCFLENTLPTNSSSCRELFSRGLNTLSSLMILFSLSSLMILPLLNSLMILFSLSSLMILPSLTSLMILLSLSIQVIYSSLNSLMILSKNRKID